MSPSRRLLLALLAGGAPALSTVAMAQAPPAADAAPGFTVADTLRFVFVEGRVAPSGRSVAEVSATFRVENRGPRPFTIATREAQFRGYEDFPVTAITGLHRCTATAPCERARATTIAPGSATTIRLVAQVRLGGARDPKREALAEMRSINLYLQIVRFLAPGDPDYREMPPGFTMDQTFMTSMNFQDSRGVLENRMPPVQ